MRCRVMRRCHPLDVVAQLFDEHRQLSHLSAEPAHAPDAPGKMVALGAGEWCSDHFSNPFSIFSSAFPSFRKR